MSRRIVFVVLAILFPSSAFAQTLADRVPGDAMIYIGWRGSDSLGSAYDASHLKAILSDSNVPQLFSEFIPRLIERVGKEDPRAAEMMRIVATIGAPTWRHPSAFYVAAPDANAASSPPRVTLLCQAGANAPSVQLQLQTVIARNPDAASKVQVKTVGDLVVASTIEYSGKPPETLAASRAFKDAMANVSKDPAATIYVDVQRVVAMVDQMQPNPRPDATWPRVRDAFGLAGLKTLIWTGSFDGKDWISRAFVAAPAAERSGVVAMMGGKPLTDDIFKTIPQTATIAGAGRCDLAKLYDGAIDAATKVDPNTRQQIDQGVQFINQVLNMDVRSELLEPLGDGWAYYTDPTVGGNGILGLTIINKLDNAAKAEQALTKLETSINTLVRQQLQKQKLTVQFLQTKVGDLTIHYLALPAITPAWTIRNGNLYLALYPQVLASAVHATDSGKTILDNKQFVAVRERLGGKNASSVQFLDLPKTAADGYQTWLFLSRLYLGMGDLFGVQSPAMVLPPLDKLLPHLSPAGSVAWTDDAGWHATAISPFPASAAIASGGSIGAATAAQSGLLVSVLLPSLNRARETAKRVKCMSNLRIIAVASMKYANDHHGKFPPDLGTLYSDEDISIETFVCSPSSIPPDVRTTPRAEQAQWVNANASYVFVGAGRSLNSFKRPGESILTYEKEHNHGEDGMNVGFADGHCEWMQMPAAKKLIEEQTKPAKPNGGGL